jgi:integrase
VGRKRASGEGTLHYRESRGLWEARLPSSVDPNRRPVYGKTQAEAREKLRQAIRDAESGLVTVTGSSRLGDYLDEWLKVVGARVQTGTIAASTAVGYEKNVRLYLKPHLGRIPLRKLRPAHIEELFGAMLADGMSPATCKNARTALSSALSDAQRDDLVARNVAQLVPPPKDKHRTPSAFSREEFARIRQVCERVAWGLLFLFIAYTGLRRSEILGLRWGDVDLEAGILQVVQSINYVPKVAEGVVGARGLVTGDPKTDQSGEPMPLSPQAVELLRRQRREQTEARLASPTDWPQPPEDTHIFATSLGTPLQPSRVSNRWKEVLAEAGIPDRTRDGRPRGMHELRRTFATRLRDRGVPLEDVQRLGRWASPHVLLGIYAESDEDRLRRAATAAAEEMDR